jgi:hypothetical protein
MGAGTRPIAAKSSEGNLGRMDLRRDGAQGAERRAARKRGRGENRQAKRSLAGDMDKNP